LLRAASPRARRNGEIDHRVPLFRVWSDHRDTPWPGLLDFWGLPNLQVINRDIHAAKWATGARDRLLARTSPDTVPFAALRSATLSAA
jgi:5-methylcytosine-specific restriction endonuclease McrA